MKRTYQSSWLTVVIKSFRGYPSFQFEKCLISVLCSTTPNTLFLLTELTGYRCIRSLWWHFATRQFANLQLAITTSRCSYISLHWQFAKVTNRHITFRHFHFATVTFRHITVHCTTLHFNTVTFRYSYTYISPQLHFATVTFRHMTFRRR